jgi:DNA-binding SARP family transcriptional activator
MNSTALVLFATRLARTAPRVVVLSAPPGFRKTAVLRAYGEVIGNLVTCTLNASDSTGDLAWAITETLAVRDEARSARFAADRVAQRRHGADATSREVLRREWSVLTQPELFALYDPVGTLTTPRGAELLAELLGAFPAGRTVALVTRTSLPPALRTVVERERVETIDADDLAYTLDDVVRAASAARVSTAVAHRLHETCRGWPLVTDLLLWHAHPDAGNDVLEAAASVPFGSLLAFAVHRIILALPLSVRDALVVATIVGRATHMQLLRILGDCDDAVFAKLTGLPFCSLVDGGIVVHPEVDAALRSRFVPVVTELYERTLHVLTGDGAYVQAAHIALDANDPLRAAAIVDAAPPFTVASNSIGAYGKIIDRLDRRLITRFPNMWIATIPYRSFSLEPSTYVREAETLYYCLPPSASADQRATILMLLASAYVNFGRTTDADQLVDEALATFAMATISARSALLNFAASLRGIEGRFTQARTLALQAASAPDAFGENQSLHYIEAHDAAYHGQQERVVVIIDELVARRKREGLPLYLIYAALSGAVFSWVNGDDEHADRYLTEIEDALTPGLEVGFAPIIDAARGRPIQFQSDEPWPLYVALAHVFRAANAASAAEAVQSAHIAAAAADRRGDPYVQLLAHTAVFALDRDARLSAATRLERIVEPIESAPLKQAVTALIAGEPAGMLATLLARFSGRAVRVPSRTSIYLLPARVVQNGGDVQLTDKEFELLALLALTRGSLSRDRIGEALWDHLDPAVWPNNFKVTVHRIRKKLRGVETILADGGGFRLAPAVDVDLRRFESAVRTQGEGSMPDARRSELREIVDSFRADVSARYERYGWGQQLLMRIGDAVCRAGVALAADALERRSFDEVSWLVDRIRECDAYNERATELTLRAMLERDDADGARREYARFAAALANELDARPSPRLAELVRRMDPDPAMHRSPRPRKV